MGCAVGDTITIEPAGDFQYADVDSASCANSEDGLILETVNGVGEAEFAVGQLARVPCGFIPDLMAGVYEITALDEGGLPSGTAGFD